jgi:hypothetical protein
VGIDTSMADFYLITLELVPELVYSPRACRIVRRVRNTVRDDLALIELDPPIPAGVYSTSLELRDVVLAPGSQGLALFSITSWPAPVYICLLKSQHAEIPDDVGDDLQIYDRGLVYRTEFDAEAALLQNYGTRIDVSCLW